MRARTAAPGASAAPSCQDGKYCLYDGADYTGLHVFADPGFNGFGWQDFNGIVS